MFLPGFIFVCIWGKLYNKRYEATMICLWSILVSFIIANFYTSAHYLVGQKCDFPEEIKTSIYIITGASFPFIVNILVNSELFKDFLLKVNFQTINSDIFDDLIDYSEKTQIAVYLKNTNFYYLGMFSLKEDNGSYIALINYAKIDIQNNEVISITGLPSSVLIPINNIERIEFFYSESSKAWNRLLKGKESANLDKKSNENCENNTSTDYSESI